ncbi:MAG: O-succinylhomoserine sulfhydrylase [Gammaproteobacteria bacterium]
MNQADFPQFGPGTRAVRAGQERSPEGEHSEALYPTSSFVFASAAQAAARFSGAEPGNVYSRFTNPTVRTFERRLAALEGGEHCIATASGMSAILTVCMSMLKAGDHIVSSRSVFGTTVGLFDNVLGRFGVATTFVDPTDYEAWRAALRPSTRMLFLETPSNPLCEIVDIVRLSGIARAHGAMLVVDNCFCTPALQRPLALGADLVVHSATKYLDGQGRCVGGAIVGPRKLLLETAFGFVRTAGPSMSPFNAWVFLKGLETLAIRMQAQSAAAARIAQWLQAQPQVERVYYPGLPEHPGHDIACRQQSGFGAIVSLDVRGGQDAAWGVIDALRIFSITANLGDTKSTITHPTTTTHHRMPAAERERAGIRPSLLRLSIGLEDVEDLQSDLGAALARI